jgi:hypothetical protein
MSLSNKPGCDSDRLSCSASLRIRPLATPDRLAACAPSSVARPSPPSPRIPEGRQAGRQSESAQLRPDKVRPAPNMSASIRLHLVPQVGCSILVAVPRAWCCHVHPPLCMRLLPRDRDIMTTSVHRIPNPRLRCTQDGEPAPNPGACRSPAGIRAADWPLLPTRPPQPISAATRLPLPNLPSPAAYPWFQVLYPVRAPTIPIHPLQPEDGILTKPSGAEQYHRDPSTPLTRLKKKNPALPTASQTLSPPRLLPCVIVERPPTANWPRKLISLVRGLGQSLRVFSHHASRRSQP